MGKRRASQTISRPKKRKGIEYEVEKVLDKREFRGETQYRLTWKGFSEQHDSWEPAANCIRCHELIAEYERRIKEEEESGKDKSSKIIKDDDVDSDSTPPPQLQPQIVDSVDKITENPPDIPDSLESYADIPPVDMSKAAMKAPEKESPVSSTTTAGSTSLVPNCVPIPEKEKGKETEAGVVEAAVDVHVNGIEKETELEKTAAVTLPTST